MTEDVWVICYVMHELHRFIRVKKEEETRAERCQLHVILVWYRK